MNMMRYLMDRVESLSKKLGLAEGRLQAALDELDAVKQQRDCYKADVEYYRSENLRLHAMEEKVRQEAKILAERHALKSVEKFGWRESEKIPMIKDLREATGCGLADGKRAIEEVLARGQ
jgi:ribosomal protein L7/L12